MFGRRQHPNITRAEQAARAGRFDEAADLLAAPELTGDRRAADLRADLFKPLMNRAQEHLLSGRFRDCLMDLDRAARCDVDSQDVEEWRRRALAAVERFGQRERVERRAVDAAANHLAQGAVTLAGAHVAQLPDAHPEKARLSTEAEQRAERARFAVGEARGALKAGHFAAAVDRVLAARQDHAASREVIELVNELVEKLSRRVRDSLAEGALDPARHELAMLKRLDAGRPEVAELDRAAGWLDQAGEAVRRARFDDARMLIRKAAQIAGSPRWLRDVQEHIDQITQRLTALAEGPLGLRSPGPGIGADVRATPMAETMVAARHAGGVAARPVTHDVAFPHAGGDAGSSPRRLLLRIDGAGSYLLLRSDRVAIGRNGSTADLPIWADLSEHHAEIIRTGDDYFLLGSTGVELAGHPVRQALLSHGDRIQLNRRVRLTFERPSRKSPTAILKLGDGVRSLPDVRRAILWSGPILIGATPECHIPLRSNDGPFVLVDRGNELQLRPMPGALDVGSLSRPVTLAIGQSFQAGNLSLSLNVVTESMAGLA